MGKNLYSTGEFAKKASVSVRTIHYYEKMGLIKPERISDSGYRYYGEEEFARIQRILTLKLLGFSLEEIQALSVNETNTGFLQQSFEMQRSLVRKKIEHLKAVEDAIQNVSQMFGDGKVAGGTALYRLRLEIRFWVGSVPCRPFFGYKARGLLPDGEWAGARGNECRLPGF